MELVWWRKQGCAVRQSCLQWPFARPEHQSRALEKAAEANVTNGLSPKPPGSCSLCWRRSYHMSATPPHRLNLGESHTPRFLLHLLCYTSIGLCSSTVESCPFICSNGLGPSAMPCSGPMPPGPGIGEAALQWGSFPITGSFGRSPDTKFRV